MHPTYRSTFLLAMFLLLALGPATPPATAQSPMPPTLCFDKRWRPDDVMLKDHALFRYDGYFYVVSILIPTDPAKPHAEAFAYARTRDFCKWENLGSVLSIGPAGAPDEWQIWAPHVISFGSTWYMFYTGVNKNFAQSIMLATSTNPADPQSWVRQGQIFVPSHPDVLYDGPHTWSDARDPMVFYDWQSRQYFLYYSAMNKANCPNNQTTCGIIGAATAKRLSGPWEDQGAVLKLTSRGIPESPYVVSPGLGGAYYAFYNLAAPAGSPSQGQMMVSSSSPTGPWSTPTRFLPGWASDFFQSSEGWVMSYLGYFEIGVTPLLWNEQFSPPRPQSVNERRIFLPIIQRERSD